MACSRSPPPSPRAPKIQQQSWDDCATPPVDLFNPRKSIRDSPKSRNSLNASSQDDSPKLYREQKSPKSPQKFTYGTKATDAPYFNEMQHFSLEEPPRSPKITYSTPSPTSSKMACVANMPGNISPSTGYFEQRSPKYLSHQSSPRKFVFDAVSPRRESVASSSGFSVATPNDTVDMHEFETTSPNSSYRFPSSVTHSIKLKRQSSLHYKRTQQYHQPQHDLVHNKQHPNKHSPSNFDLIKQSSDPLHSSTLHSNFVTDSLMYSSNGLKQQHQQQPPQQQQAQQSLPTLPQQQQQQRRQSSNEAASETSAATTALCGESTTTTDTSRQSSSDWRRQAMNITSNPSYQALHTSHSTLDRTCSDSVMSLCCRKSTSDLTAVTESNTGAPVASHHRRRGSSKGGLALLASRRNSRDSIKSVASNSSLFSNEDVGPLAFQTSARGRQRRTSNFLELPVPDHQRPRVCSLPDRPYNPRQSDDLYRLRTFSISKGTVVNCGDSIISRRSRSNTSVNSTTSRASERSPFEGSCCGKGYTTVDSLPPSPTESGEIPPPPRYRVVLFGDAGTGKTALVSQFTTSEYMHTYDASLDDEFGEKTVSVLLDGEESEIVFIDHPSSEMSVENSLSTYEPHACVIVYSVVQRSSFRQAEEIVKYLWRENVTKEKAVILVGNKADLARSRVIPTAEGKALAKSIDAKFIETSSGIQHNVDELLVGILKQIRLKETRDKKAAAQHAMKMRSSRTHISLHLAKEILQKICLSDITKSRSCENLHVL